MMRWRSTLVSVVIIMVLASASSAAEVGTELIQGMGGSGRLTLAFPGERFSPMLEATIAKFGGSWAFGVDVWLRRYIDDKWVAIGVGWRDDDNGGFSVASALIGVRVQVTPAFIVDPAFGIQVRSNGTALITQKIYLGIRL